jgi:hypothetical protein
VQREKVKNQSDLTVSRTVPLNSGSLGAIQKVIPNLDGQFKSGCFEKQYVQTVVSLNQTLSVDYKPIEDVRKSNFRQQTSSILTEMCSLCSSEHPMWKCKKFFTLGVKQRFKVVQAVLSLSGSGALHFKMQLQPRWILWEKAVPDIITDFYTATQSNSTNLLR